MVIRELTLEVLESPRRRSHHEALGFVGGEPVGYASPPGGVPAGFRWRAEGPEAIATPNPKKVSDVLTARGDRVGGSYRARPGERALLWSLVGEALDCTDLHVEGFSETRVTGIGEGLTVGIAATADVDFRALLWTEGRGIVLEPGDLEQGSVAFGVGGGLVVGRHGASGSMRACAWDVGSHERIDLHPLEFDSSRALDAGEGYQVGEARAVGADGCPILWRGSAKHEVLSPAGYHGGFVRSCDGNLQVGAVRRDAEARFEAALWAGSRESFVNLGEAVPEPFNASLATLIEVEGSDVRIAGTVVEYASERPTAVAQTKAAVWRARLER